MTYPCNEIRRKKDKEMGLEKRRRSYRVKFFKRREIEEGLDILFLVGFDTRLSYLPRVSRTCSNVDVSLDLDDAGLEKQEESL